MMVKEYDGIFEVKFKYDNEVVNEGDIFKELKKFLKDRWVDKVFILDWKPYRPR